MTSSIVNDYPVALRLQKVIRQIDKAIEDSYDEYHDEPENEVSARLVEMLRIVGMLSRELYKSQDLRVSAFGMCLVNLELGLSIEAIDWLKLEMIREAKEGGILMERELDMVKSKISETKSRYDSASLISLELG